ncbi:MAG: phosphatidylserine decarboxylase related protein [Bryobacterales bacterium]|nr:phosphatidylserine decarboxylase related protein [Bryobacterales bacterium]
MVRDGLYYGAGLTIAGVLLSTLVQPWSGLPLFVLAAFCLYFFRDPEREIPGGQVAVSPADGKVVAVRPEGASSTRISIFLNIFDVHVNRTPIAGTITDVKYRKGRFLVASKEVASVQNEQNTMVVEGNGTRVVFSQIAGLIARRIVCNKKPGDTVSAGERIGLIKFGSRMDVVFGREWDIVVHEGMHVAAGSSVLARRNDVQPSSEAGTQMSTLEPVECQG